jgi:RNA polymerase sigma factor (TIGR02999 family)
VRGSISYIANPQENGSLGMNQQDQTAIPSLLTAVRRGEAGAFGQLFSIVYHELRGLARVQRRRLPKAETLNTTALVHEAFLKLVRNDAIDLHDRAHFMAVAATAMRRILISYARRQTALKRGGGKARVSLDDIERAFEHQDGFNDASAEGLVALDRALSRLSEHAERQGRVVDCRFFGGMSIEQTAIALNISPATVKRDWSLAQAWLYRDLQQELP